MWEWQSLLQITHVCGCGLDGATALLSACSLVRCCSHQFVFPCLEVLLQGTPPPCTISCKTLPGHSVDADSLHISCADIFISQVRAAAFSHQGSPQRIFNLQLLLSSASSSFTSTSAMSSFTTSINLLFGLPRFLFPGNSIFSILLPIYPSSFLSTCIPPQSRLSCFLSTVQPVLSLCIPDFVQLLMKINIFNSHLHLRLLSFRQCHPIQHCWSHCHPYTFPFTLADTIANHS